MEKTGCNRDAPSPVPYLGPIFSRLQSLTSLCHYNRSLHSTLLPRTPLPLPPLRSLSVTTHLIVPKSHPNILPSNPCPSTIISSRPRSSDSWSVHLPHSCGPGPVTSLHVPTLDCRLTLNLYDVNPTGKPCDNTIKSISDPRLDLVTTVTPPPLLTLSRVSVSPPVVSFRSYGNH